MPVLILEGSRGEIGRPVEEDFLSDLKKREWYAPPDQKLSCFRLGRASVSFPLGKVSPVPVVGSFASSAL